MATSRPRGFINGWKPKTETVDLIDNVSEILVDNSQILPLTLRQIFYLLVTGYGYDKTEQAYKRLCETMNKARRARMVSMQDIRDDGLRKDTPHSWDDEDDIIYSFKYWARNMRLPRQRGQETHTMVWCEAGGMLPQLANACKDYGVTVLSSGGFDSVTTKHNFARDVANDFGRVEILHIGDHDPSGVHMCSSLDEDLNAFVAAYGGVIDVTRLAVIPDQIRAMGLPTSPPKKTDNRSFSGMTTQAEAIPPKTLRSIVQSAILERLDLDIYHDVLAEEEVIRASLVERLEGI